MEKKLHIISCPDAVILLWKLNDSKELEPLAFQDEDEAQLNKENWTVVKTLRYFNIFEIFFYSVFLIPQWILSFSTVFCSVILGLPTLSKICLLWVHLFIVFNFFVLIQGQPASSVTAFMWHKEFAWHSWCALKLVPKICNLLNFNACI